MVAVALVAVVQAQTFVGIPKEKFDYVAASQHEDNWCWAATIQMMLNYYGIPVTQEEIVKNTFGTNRYGELPDVPASHRIMTENLNTAAKDEQGKLKEIRAELHFGSPDPSYLIEQLALEHPVLISYETGESTEHAVIITGVSYVETSHGPELDKIIVRDPWPSEEKLSNLGRVEYDGLRFSNLITAYWEIDISNTNTQSFANLNQRTHQTTIVNQLEERNQSSSQNNRYERTTADRNDRYTSTTSTSARSMSDRSVTTTSRPRSASSSSPYSAAR